jgi:3-deoxy-D-manno-octulosonic-acid transferase
MLGGWIREALRSIRVACMQSEDDAERARSLGIPPERVRVTGNMKFDRLLEDERAGGLELPIPSAAPVIVAGSTSPGEEEAVVDAFETLRREGFGDAILVLAPRHRERFDEVARMLGRRGLPFIRRSAMSGGAAGQETTAPVILLDTLGELARAYGRASVAFVGGSLVPRGGQNLIEPAARGVPVLFGRHTENFERVAQALLAAGAGFRVSGPEELAGTLGSLLANPIERLRAGSAGRALVETHRGATERTLHHILPFLG